MVDDRFAEMLGPYVLGELTASEEAEMDRHLEACPNCRRELDQIRQTHDLLQKLPTPPPELKARVIANATSSPQSGSSRWKLWIPAAAALLVAAVLGLSIYFFTSSPDGVPLSATALAPGAGGEVRGEADGENFRVELTVQGLPRLREGEYYEMWYVDEEGGRISCGTFRAQGETTVNLTAPGSAVDYPEIEVTREAGDGDPGPSEQVVLKGDLRDA